MHERMYQVFKNDQPAEDFAEFADIINLWRSRIPEGKTKPCWSDFEFEDFTNWYGRISLGEIHGQNNLYMVLWGTQLVDWWGTDHTKKYLNDVQNTYGLNWDDGEGSYIKYLIKNDGIGRWIGPLNIVDRGMVVIECIDLLMRKDDRTSHVFSAYIKRNYDYVSGFSVTPEYTTHAL
jgi:hypothetical protein